MASKTDTSVTSTIASTSLDSPTPTKLPAEAGFNLAAFRDSAEGAKLVNFILEQFTRTKSERESKKQQWVANLAMFHGQQWTERMVDPRDSTQKLMTPRAPYYRKRKTINRTRSFVRTEHSKFLSSIPNAVAVPSTAEDQDVRAAFAAEQAWESISDTKKLRNHFTKAIWWTIVTGNGFMKTWWDQGVVVDKEQNIFGDIRFGHVTPFHLFVPDLREMEIEDQPYLINAYSRSVEWCRLFYAEELRGVNLAPSVSSGNSIIEDNTLNLAAPTKASDSVNVYEFWCKPGATSLMPEGGMAVIVDKHLVSLSREGLPYAHNQYPYTKFEHIPNGTFYADSPLVDTNQLQKEYNTLRTEISEAGSRMAKPQLLAPKGSIVASKITNEPGQVIEYKAGFNPPTPLQLSPLPQYYVDQQNVILSDWEDITGQHEVSKGGAPAGITAGTAINYLQEKDNQFLTPEYQSVEDGYEKMGVQSLSLFVQFVDTPRKIKTIGADQAFDTVLLSGADIKNGTDLRIQRGSSVGQSQAAKEAKVMDMFGLGLLQPDQALKLLEVGGAQKILDTLSVAEKKAQRENMKMKMMSAEDVLMAQMEFDQAVQSGQIDAEGLAPDDLEGGIPEQPMPSMPPMILADDFDIHEVHIETHNRFRMGQEYETLPEEIKEQFAAHVAMHQQFLSFAMPEGEMPTDGMPAEEHGHEGEEPPVGPDAMMGGDGAAPAPPVEGE